jgi:hypothetical protein
LVRVPLDPTFVLLQDGQRSGGLTPESGRVVVLVTRAVWTVRGMRDVIKGGIGKVTNLQGGAAGGATRWVTDMQGRAGYEYAKVRGKKVLWAMGCGGGLLGLLSTVNGVLGHSLRRRRKAERIESDFGHFFLGVAPYLSEGAAP